MKLVVTIKTEFEADGWLGWEDLIQDVLVEPVRPGMDLADAERALREFLTDVLLDDAAWTMEVQE